MKKKTSNYLNIFLIVMAPIVIYTGVQNSKNNEKIKEKEGREYPRITIVSKEFKGVIYEISQSKYWAGTYIVSLTGGQNFSIWSNSRNYDYGKKEVMNFLEVGDSIHKPIDSDSLLIFRGAKEYYFILGKDINEKQ